MTLAVPPAIRRLSPQQAAVVEWTRDGKGSAFVQAVAGAGKTTTLIELLRETSGSVAFAAYNKKIATEISTKVNKLNLGNRVRVGTFHSFGFGAWRRIHANVKVDANGKADSTVAALKIPRTLESFTGKLISLAKQRALGLFGAVNDESKWYDIVDHFDMAYDVEGNDALIKQGVELAMAGLQHHRDIAHELIDFDDMIYMPLVSGCRMWENDWILIDEAQDTNPARRALARKMLRQRGRAVFVGDKHQAIYGFTGADNDAIDQIIRDFKCIELPLTVTFRCPKIVVEKAREIVSHIEAHDTAPEGKFSDMSEQDLPRQAFHATDDAVLCRKTKPLVQLAYQLIRIGTPCHVEGRDIGMGLLKLVNRFDATSLDALRRKLDAYMEIEMEKLIAKGRETQAEALKDRVDTVCVIADNCKSVDELRTKIVDMFQDADNEAKPTLTLSTVHKSKGREWKRVFVLGRNAWMPSPYARQQWQLDQENNLIYVAYTRAMSELVLVHVDGP